MTKGMRAPSTKTGFLLLLGEEDRVRRRKAPAVVVAAARAARAVAGTPEFIMVWCLAWSGVGPSGLGLAVIFGELLLCGVFCGVWRKFLFPVFPGVYAS